MDHSLTLGQRGCPCAWKHACLGMLSKTAATEGNAEVNCQSTISAVQPHLGIEHQARVLRSYDLTTAVGDGTKLDCVAVE